MKVQRAVVLISKMSKLTLDDITKDEAYELWGFLDEEYKLPITKTRLKINLAKECGVFIEQLDAVANGASLAEILVMESSDSAGNNLTLKEVKSLFLSITGEEDWVIPFCHKMNITEAEFVWRWALNERWRSIRNRMRRWAKQFSKIYDDVVDTYTMLDVIFGLSTKEQVSKPVSTFKRLRKWEGISIPDNFWFITNCGTLLFIEENIVRNRNGEINREYTPQVGSAEDCWCWVNALGTTRLHTVNQEISFSSYKEPLDISWREANKILYDYPKGGYLILHEGEYYLYTKGTPALYVQALSVRMIKTMGYEFIIGVKDGLTDVIDVSKMRIRNLPFELENILKKYKIPIQNSHSSHDIPFLVIQVAYSWRAEDGWGWRYMSTHEDLSIHDVDDYTTYISLVGVDNE